MLKGQCRNAPLRNRTATAASRRYQRLRLNARSHGYETHVPARPRLQHAGNHPTHECQYRRRNHALSKREADVLSSIFSLPPTSLVCYFLASDWCRETRRGKSGDWFFPGNKRSNSCCCFKQSCRTYCLLSYT